MSEKAGWEVEGFVARLTRRDDTNSERLILEAISHLRAFSRDCDALRDDNIELRAEIEQLKAEHDMSDELVATRDEIERLRNSLPMRTIAQQQAEIEHLRALLHRWIVWALAGEQEKTG